MAYIEYGEFVNEYGIIEKYVRKEITSYKTGHVYLGSAFETYYDCGNCDGGRCHICKDKYEVIKYAQPVEDVTGGSIQKVLNRKVFNNETDAIEYYKML